MAFERIIQWDLPPEITINTEEEWIALCDQHEDRTVTEPYADYVDSTGYRTHREYFYNSDHVKKIEIWIDQASFDEVRTNVPAGWGAITTSMEAAGITITKTETTL